jgi:hypothetical protein
MKSDVILQWNGCDGYWGKAKTKTNNTSRGGGRISENETTLSLAKSSLLAER